jgi:hypothetical protein
LESRHKQKEGKYLLSYAMQYLMISCHGGPKRLEISGGDAEDQVEGTFRKAELEERPLALREEGESLLPQACPVEY